MLEHKSTENENFSGSKERVKEENCIQNFLQNLQNSIQKTIQNFLFFFTFLRQIAQFYSLNWIAPRGRHLQNKKIKNILNKVS